MELVKESILKAAALTVLILVIGILVGLQADSARTDFLQKELEESAIRSQTLIVTENYLSDSSRNYCQVVSNQIPELAEKNADIGSNLQSFTSKSVSRDRTYKNLKEEYYVNQLRLYNTLQNYNERCNANISTVFFFFDNSIASQRQGAVLTKYRREVDNQTHVFSYNLETVDSQVMEILKEDLNVSSAPTIVINGNRTFRRYVSFKELKKVI